MNGKRHLDVRTEHHAEKLFKLTQKCAILALLALALHACGDTAGVSGTDDAAGQDSGAGETALTDSALPDSGFPDSSGQEILVPDADGSAQTDTEDAATDAAAESVDAPADGDAAEPEVADTAAETGEDAASDADTSGATDQLDAADTAPADTAEVDSAQADAAESDTAQADADGQTDAISPTDTGSQADAQDATVGPDAAEETTAADAADADAGAAKVDPCPFPSAPAAGEPGAACKSAKECNSGVCVDSSEGQICSSLCSVCCPLGFACLNLSFTSTPQYACASTSTALCKPCNADGECQSPTSAGALCVSSDSGGFCGIACGSDDECPIGYDCKSATGSAASGKQCVPSSGECSCSAKAVALKASTKCKIVNVFGTCNGVRACSSDGLSDCSANVPAADECNGLDDNCDGKTDEGATDTDKDGLADCVDPDMDADGTPNAADCAPLNAAIHPGAKEVCNGADDDCDGTTDVDASSCVKYYGDGDGDGHGKLGAVATCLCAPPPNAATSADDCNDANADVYPGAKEVCDDVDNNCDTQVDPGCDDDGDGWCDAAYVTVGTPNVCVHGGGDCADNAAATHPAAAETCNGVDDDCDGKTDPADTTGCTSFYADFDGDGYGVGSPACLCGNVSGWSASKGGDCDDNQKGVHPGATETCNGYDDNCDGSTDEPGAGGCAFYYADADADNFGSAGDAACLCAKTANYPVTNAFDCNDAVKAIHPGATEECDGVDNNCDSVTDGAGSSGCVAYYVDYDTDGYGNSNLSACLCMPDATHKTLLGGDCNDTTILINPGVTEKCDSLDNNCNGATDEANASGCATYLRDHDGDLYGVTADSQCLCKASGEYTASIGGDCNDAAGGVHPNASEVCNSVDDNCDGSTDPLGAGGCTTWTLDNDGDGYGASGGASFCACSGVPGYASKTGDCTDSDASIHPNATEACNGVDDNCDGATDGIGSTGCSTFYPDVDQDGYGVTASGQCRCEPSGTTNALVGGDCNDGAVGIHPGATETCNSVDDNCSGSTDEGLLTTFYTDADGDGYGGSSKALCAANATYTITIGGDCNDSSASIKPGATETCNGLDDNCNSQTDEGLAMTTYYVDSDGDGYGTGAGSARCGPGGGFTASVNGDCNDGSASVKPSATETCNGVDDNCNGATDEGFTGNPYYKDADGDGYGAGASVYQCSPGGGYTVLVNGDCNDNSASVHPGATETCNSVDDNCNSKTDEGLAQAVYYQDADKDGYGYAYASIVGCKAPSGFVSNSTDCNDLSAAIHPGATEVCSNNIDDNCNGSTDENCIVCTPQVLYDFESGTGNWQLTQNWWWDVWNATQGYAIIFENYYTYGYPASSGTTAYAYITIPQGAKYLKVDALFSNLGTSGVDTSASMTFTYNGSYQFVGPYSYSAGGQTLTWAVNANDWGQSRLLEVYTYTAYPSSNPSGGFGIDNVRVTCN